MSLNRIIPKAMPAVVGVSYLIHARRFFIFDNLKEKMFIHFLFGPWNETMGEIKLNEKSSGKLRFILKLKFIS